MTNTLKTYQIVSTIITMFMGLKITMVVFLSRGLCISPLWSNFKPFADCNNRVVSYFFRYYINKFSCQTLWTIRKRLPTNTLHVRENFTGDFFLFDGASSYLLSFEARQRGLPHYKWMYPFKKFIQYLKIMYQIRCIVRVCEAK